MVALAPMALSSSTLGDMLLYDGAQAALQVLRSDPHLPLAALQEAVSPLTALHQQLCLRGVALQESAVSIQSLARSLRYGQVAMARSILTRILQNGLAPVPLGIYSAAAADAGCELFRGDSPHQAYVTIRERAEAALAESRVFILSARETRISNLIEYAQGMNEATLTLLQEAQSEVYPFTAAQILRLLEKAVHDRDLYPIVHHQVVHFPSLLESIHVPGLLEMAVAMEYRLPFFLRDLVRLQKDRDIFAEHLNHFMANARLSEAVALALKDYKTVHPEKFPTPQPRWFADFATLFGFLPG